MPFKVFSVFFHLPRRDHRGSGCVNTKKTFLGLLWLLVSITSCVKELQWLLELRDCYLNANSDIHELAEKWLLWTVSNCRTCSSNVYCFYAPSNAVLLFSSQVLASNCCSYNEIIRVVTVHFASL